MITIDGSYASGSGQILRTACSLSAVTKEPCRIFNIRKDRPKPGLALQHLVALQSLAKLCNGRMEGVSLNSKEVKFHPGPKIETSSPLRLKIGTAASITLILQALIPAALFSEEPVKIIFEGGATDTFFSPPIDYFQYVFLGILEKIGIRVDVKIVKRGFYPAGGARVEVIVYPGQPKPISLLERGELKEIIIISGASSSLQKQRVSKRQLSGIKGIIGTKLKLPITEKEEYYPTLCPGSHVNIIAYFQNTVIGINNLGKIGKPAEEVGKEAALSFLKQAKNNDCLDNYMADQILCYMALSKKRSMIAVSEPTEHCKGIIYVIEKFLKGRFEIKTNLISWEPE